VQLPPLKLVPGDVVTPLPDDAPLPSSDPKNLEGIWVGLGAAVTADGQPPPYLPEVQANAQRRRELEKRGTPAVEKGALCRPPGEIAVEGNQFPTQILQRPDKIIFIAEENRGVWSVYMNAEHPKELQPTYTGHNVGHWEGNTLVIDSIGFNGKPNSGKGSLRPTHSSELHVVTRITRANTGDKRNGDRLVVSRTYEDPKVFQHPWTSTNMARWRPDLQMLEFNCEESSTSLAADGLKVE
jgi:hypothetical protein